MATLIKNRYEFVLFYDVENGNPNGDPDADNMPRIDPETSFGLVSDVCIKRKIRNYIALAKDDTDNYKIYVQEKAILNNQHKKAYDYLRIEPISKKLPKDKAHAEALTQFMCKNFYDIRTFGAVMTTEINCGQVRGPVQLGFSRSLDPIVPQEITITRMAVTNEKDLEKERTMGRKHIVNYALYRVEGFISAPLAQQTGFSEEDLELFWEALINMFEHDRSAARGKMSSRKLFVFKHNSKLGNAPANILFDSISAKKIDKVKPPRAFTDYEIVMNSAALPQGVEVLELL
jgi:CRISPR-associated protein Csd2